MKSLISFIKATIELRENAQIVLNRLISESNELADVHSPFSAEVKTYATNLRDLIKPLWLVADLPPLRERINVLDAKLRLSRQAP